MRARIPPVQHLLRGVINVAYTRFKADKDIMDALVLYTPEEQKRSGGEQLPESSAGDASLGHALR